MKKIILSLTICSFCFAVSAQQSSFLKTLPQKSFSIDKDWMKKLPSLPVLQKNTYSTGIDKIIRVLPLDNMPCLIAENTGGAQIPNKLSGQTFPAMPNKFNTEIIPLN